MPDIAFVTTCKGRMRHIQRTLPSLVEQSPDEIVVVDYGCPDGVGDWVADNYPDIAVVRVNDDPGFCVARARNRGAQNVKSTWICFIDADVQAKPGWVEWMRNHLDTRFFYQAGARDGVRDKETWGTFLCAREAFEQVEGYDEVFRGWGGEDEDIYSRLRISGLAAMSYPARFAAPIRHGETERLRYYDIKDRNIHYFINRLYSEAKLRIMTFRGSNDQLPLPTRTDLMNKVKETVLNWSEGKTDQLPTITITSNETAWLPKPYRLLKKFTFTLTMDEIEDPVAGSS